MLIKIKKIIPLLIIILISISLRLIFLDKIPTGISDDELDYTFTAKTVYFTGTDISGKWNPFSLTTPPSEFPKAELPYLFIAPFIGPLSLSLFAARLPFVFYNIILIITLYCIASRIFGKSQAIIVGLIAAINPWMIFFSRTAFDSPLAVLFYFIAFLILLYAKKWKLLFAFPFLLFAFYSYIGTKIILIPFTLLVIIYSWSTINNKKYFKQYLILFIFILTIILYYIINLQLNKTSSRISELLSPSHPYVTKEVDNQRKLSVETPVKNIYSNKITVFLNQSAEKYLGVFSTQFLFLYGDSRSTFSVWNHGVFYVLDIFFIIIGLYGLYRKEKSALLLLTSLILIAPIPSTISTVGTTYPIRAALLFPSLILVIGYGIWYAIYSLKTNYKKPFIILITVTYMVLLSNFLNIYFFRNPIYNSEGFGFSGRIIAKYLDLAKRKEQKILFISDRKEIMTPIFRQYLFFTNEYNKYTINEFSKLTALKANEYKNIKSTTCPKEEISSNVIIIVPTDFQCESLKKYQDESSIARLSDGGEIFKIYNDNVCSNYQLKRFPIGINFNDFDIEHLSEERFCTQFITKFD